MIASYAETADGIAWKKPNLGMVEFNGSKDNNIIGSRRMTQGWIMLDVAEKNPARRHKGLNEHNRQFAVIYSPDGIHWTVGEPTHGMVQEDDQPGLFYDAAQQKYVFVKRSLAGKFRRRSQIAFSDDLIHWKVNPYVFAPNEKDAERAAQRSAQRMDFYSATIFPYEGIYLGRIDCFYLSMIGEPGRPARFHDGSIESELMWSRDAVHWTRVAPRHWIWPTDAFACGFCSTAPRSKSLPTMGG